MKKTDIKDTIECRKQIVEYVEYLKKGNEDVSDDFVIHIITEIFSESSVKAYKAGMEKVADKLAEDVEEGEDMDTATEMFNESKVLLFKHCLLLEIKHNHTKADSIKLNPAFIHDNINFA